MPCNQHPHAALKGCSACGQLRCPVCACGACGDAGPDAPPLRVASWNIKTLGKQFHHRQLSVVRLLAAIMLRMRADVICLMEVMEGFGPKHAVDIVEEMKKMSATQWRVRFPGTYTGAGGRNGLETYAVVYNAALFELTSFELVGQEIGYSRDEWRKRQPDPASPVVTRKPAQAVFRPRPACTHFAFYPEFRIIIFHAPSVAEKDYGLACHAIRELGKLPVFAMQHTYPYTILCADLNIDEEAANHVHPREEQDFDELVVKSREQAERDIAAYNAAHERYSNAVNALDELRQLLALELTRPNQFAQLVQVTLEIRTWQAERAAALKSKGKKRDARRLKADQELQRLEGVRTNLEQCSDRQQAEQFLNRYDGLEQEVIEAREALAEAQGAAESDLPTDEEEVLAATEAAFEPLAQSNMFSNLDYSDDFRTTLRLSVHMACTREPRAPHYDEELTLESFVYSNFDQVLVRATDGSAWGEVRPSVINLMGAVMPEADRTRLKIDTAPTPALRPLNSKEQWMRLLARAYGGNRKLLAELRAEFGENLTAIDPDTIDLVMPEDDVEEDEGEGDEGEGNDLEDDDDERDDDGAADVDGGAMADIEDDADVEDDEDDDDPVQRDYGPVEAAYLVPFLAEREVFAGALVAAYKRFVDMNNSNPLIDSVRKAAQDAVATPDPIAHFCGNGPLWNLASARNAVRYVADGQHQRLFEINVFLTLANVLSDHLPVIVEIEMVPPEWRPETPAQSASIPSRFALPAFAPVVNCSATNAPAPCRNLANCCATCDEHTSLKTADGFLTGYQLVRAAAEVCRAFMAKYHPDTGPLVLGNRKLWLVGGRHWTFVAGHLLYVKQRSAGFAIARGTEYFWGNANILIGRDGIEVERELCSIRNELAARKHPRILFVKAGGRQTATQAQAVADTGDDDTADVQDDTEDEGKGDWSYPTIAKKFGVLDGATFARDVLSLLRTGQSRTSDASLAQAYAGLLVTLFGVEANKDNSTYLTGILALQGIAARRYTIGEVFYQVDPGNACNLAGSLGLFPLASSDRANLDGKRRCVMGRATLTDCAWSEPMLMSAVLDIQPRSRDNIIVKKEMVLLVDDVRARRPYHFLFDTSVLLQDVKKEWMALLEEHYGDVKQ